MLEDRRVQMSYLDTLNQPTIEQFQVPLRACLDSLTCHHALW